MILDRCSSGFISVGFGTSIVAKKCIEIQSQKKKITSMWKIKENNEKMFVAIFYM